MFDETSYWVSRWDVKSLASDMARCCLSREEDIVPLESNPSAILIPVTRTFYEGQVDTLMTSEVPWSGFWCFSRARLASIRLSLALS